jgi:hypothetical protein
MRSTTARPDLVPSLALGASLALTAAVIGGCSSSPEAVTPATSASEAPATSASASSTASAPSTSKPLSASSEATSPMTVKLVKIDPSKESEFYLHVTMSFANPNEHPCKVQSYVVTWPGGSKEIKKEFTVAPKDSAERSVKVHADDGKLDALKVEAATVSLKSDCGPT